MKKIILTLTILLTLNLSAQSGFGNDYIFASDNFIEVDKQYHFVFGGLLAVGGYCMGLDIHEGDRVKAIWTGVALGTLGNFAKEVTDPVFNTTDLLYGFAGSVVSSWLTDKLFHKNYQTVQEVRLERLKRYEQKRFDEMSDEEKLLSKIKL